MKQKVYFLIILTINCISCSTQNSFSDENTIYFRRVKEPNEGAFTVLVPKGWQTKGGIFRLDPTAIGGAGNAIAAKYDFTVINNDNEDVQIRWLPDYLFFDMRQAPAAAFFPPGSNYNGMEVRYKTDPVTFIMEMVIPYAHPNIADVIKTSEKSLPKLAKVYQDYASRNPILTMAYNAAMISIDYTENGKQYEEMIIAVIEDYGQLGAGLWGNKGCVFIRAPKGELNNWVPFLETIHTSIKTDTRWLIGELKSQKARGGKMIEVQQQILSIDQEIADHQQKTNHEIRNNIYLVLTGQEEFVNPYTNEIEIGTNQWQHRWQNNLGEIIYTDNENYDPNNDPNLHVSGFKRSSIMKR